MFSYPMVTFRNTKFRLTVQSQYGCSHTFESTIKVNPSPQALFNTSDSGCVPVVTRVYRLCQKCFFLELEFGDGHTSSEQNPVHIYNNPGEYL
jgi:hypothetical protein